MTKKEWLACTDPTPMLEFLWRKGSHRKLRLFACACCRRVRHLLTGKKSRIAVEVAEHHADGLATDDRLAEATDLLEIVAPEGRPYPNAPAYYATWQHAPDAATNTAQAAVEAIAYIAGNADAERAAQVASLHVIFGTLRFRRVTIAPAWLAWNDATVVNLAQATYDARQLPGGHLNYAKLAILADALEEAGCANADILTHLREPRRVHVRGCWVVDLLLGKK